MIRTTNISRTALAKYKTETANDARCKLKGRVFFFFRVAEEDALYVTIVFTVSLSSRYQGDLRLIRGGSLFPYFPCAAFVCCACRLMPFEAPPSSEGITSKAVRLSSCGMATAAAFGAVVTLRER